MNSPIFRVVTYKVSRDPDRPRVGRLTLTLEAGQGMTFELPVELLHRLNDDLVDLEARIRIPNLPSGRAASSHYAD